MHLRRDRRAGRRRPGRELRPPARPAQPATAAVRLHGHRRRSARALQPVRRRGDGISARRPEERRLRPSGCRLPVGSRRRDAGHLPLQRPRRRVARALPHPHHSEQPCGRRGGGPVNNGIVIVVLASAVTYGTPLVYAALGELLAERSGVLNLGVEGMMLVGAVMGFWAVQRIGGPGGLVLVLAVGVAAVAGAAVALIHAFLVITLRASQIVSGLALTIFAGAAGLSSYLGNDLNLADSPARHGFRAVNAFGLHDLPILGPIVFAQTWLVYASWVCVVLVALYLARTRPGLNVRAVGESPAAADAMGINVVRYRYAHTLVGGAFAGVGGACFSISILNQWVDGLTNGAGWIAIALVIFSFWRPHLCLVGAYLFGAFQALPLTLQAREVTVLPTEVYESLPYVMT
ncbi:MAG: ABC transporter permease, partial [Actinobacteria bacterium]